jgi:hypothetical protein
MTLYLNCIWIACSLLLAGVALRLWKHRSKFRFFVTFCLFDSLAGLTALIVRYAVENWYFYFFWSVELISSFLFILAIQELLNIGSQQVPPAAKLVTFLFYVIGIVAILLAMSAARTLEAEEWYRMVAGTIALDQGLRLMQACLLLFVILLHRLLSLSWPHQGRYIAIGAAVLSVGELIATTLRLFGGHAGDNIFVLSRPTAYLLACLVWFWTITKARSEVHQEGHDPVLLKRVKAKLENVWN